MAGTDRCGAILLVDDDPQVRQTLMRSLARRQLQVAEATSVAEAIQAALGNRFDLMLLDVNLPDASGWDILRRLRTAGSSLPVVILSATPPNPVRVREFQPFAILPKPFSIDALLRLVRSACAVSVPVGRP